MARYHTTVRSSRRAEETFDYLSDFSTTAEWDPGVVEAERLSTGPVGMGSTFRVVLAAEAQSARSVDEITVLPTDHGSEVTYDADLRGQGLFRLADPLLGLAFRRIGERARDGLTRVLAVA